MSNNTQYAVSNMAETMTGSEIIKIAWEVNAKIKAGEKIFNLTIGDYDPSIFPIPQLLKDEIMKAYANNETNYPPADGIQPLRDEVKKFLKNRGNWEYATNEILIAGGSRPLIYGLFSVLVNPNEKILFPVPSWNNNHYTHLANCEAICVETQAKNNFMPSASDLIPYMQEAALLALCSPLNPTGTCISKKDLSEICDAIIIENTKREVENKKPLYLLYDQIYWLLNADGSPHHDPVTLNEKMRPYTVYIHGISKVFASTGVRVGWAFGPEFIINKMKNFLGHVGAWAPKAEQVATAAFLQNETAVDAYLKDINSEIKKRLDAFYAGFLSLKNEGLPVDIIAPQAAIYVTVQFDLIHKKTASGTSITSAADITKYILDEAKVAIVPFYAFGASPSSTWFRISVGTCHINDIEIIINNIKLALLCLH